MKSNLHCIVLELKNIVKTSVMCIYFKVQQRNLHKIVVLPLMKSIHEAVMALDQY